MSSRLPRILYFTAHFLHGRIYGGQLRALHIARLLQQCGELKVVLMPLKAGADLDGEETKREFNIEAVVPLEPRPGRNLSERFRHEYDPYFTDTHGWQVSEENSRLIEGLLETHDVVWFNGIRTANGIGRRFWPKSVLDTEDVLSQYYRSSSEGSASFRSRIGSLRKVILWKRRERVFLKRFSILSVCSEAEKDYLGASERIHVIPNGYEAPEAEPTRSPAVPPRIGFIGSLTYAPNKEGVRWFIDSVWPRIKAKCERTKLRLVGQGTNVEFSGAGPDIDALGWLTDASEEIATWSLLIVPLHVGAGTRVKIAEAFSRKCPVVATSQGAFGYDVRTGNELLLADSPAEFASACISILSNPQLGEDLANRAWDRFQREWSWSAVQPKVKAAVNACLAFGR